MTVLLMNPNASVETTEQMCRLATPALPMSPAGWTAPSGPKIITTPEALAHAARLVATAEIPAATRCVIVAAFGDPGVSELQARLDCPVIGIGAAAARAACRMRPPFAVATTTPELAPQIDALMRCAAGNTQYAGSFFTPGDPGELMCDPDRLDAALLTAIEAARDAGAGCVIIGGGPLGSAAQRLRGHSPLPLLNPVLCAANEAAQVLKVRHDQH